MVKLIKLTGLTIWMDCKFKRVDASAHDKIIMETGDNVHSEIFGLEQNKKRDCLL